MPTFFVTADAVAPPNIRISDPLLKHLRDSLRLQAGEILTLTDPTGTRYRSEVVTITSKALEARILDVAAAPPKTTPSLILAQAVLKGEKMDWVLQKATELGVERIIPVQTKHGVVKIQPDRLSHQSARWARIALEAAQQSERWNLPTIEEPVDLNRLLTRYQSSPTNLMLAERSTQTALIKVPLPSKSEHSVVLLIGPEGGWDDAELLAAQEKGFQAVTIGKRILRAETAALAAVSIVQSRLGELG